MLSYGVVKLWTHASRLRTIDFATDNVQGNVISYDTYDDWCAPTSKAVLKTGLCELDVASQYTVHTYDQVLGLYFAQARMYDAAGRRFTATDPVKGTPAKPFNYTRYIYVHDNPLCYIDELGLFLIGMELQVGASGKDIVALRDALKLKDFVPSVDYITSYDYLDSWLMDTVSGSIIGSVSEIYYRNIQLE